MRFLACDPTLADILFFVGYSPLTSVNYGKHLLLYGRTQSQASKRSICTTFCNSPTILLIGCWRLTCDYVPAGGLRASTPDVRLIFCREVLLTGKGALLDDLKQFIGRVWSEWATQNPVVTVTSCASREWQHSIIGFKSQGLWSWEPLIGHRGADLVSLASPSSEHKKRERVWSNGSIVHFPPDYSRTPIIFKP